MVRLGRMLPYVFRHHLRTIQKRMNTRPRRNVNKGRRDTFLCALCSNEDVLPKTRYPNSAWAGRRGHYVCLGEGERAHPPIKECAVGAHEPRDVAEEPFDGRRIVVLRLHAR